MDFLAHPENARGEPHRLADHLMGVGALASAFSALAHPDLGTVAYWTGLLHDLGKYRDEFQSYLRAERGRGVDTHHAVYGAALAFERRWLGPAFAIAGHHAGLHDQDGLQSLVADPRYKAVDRLAGLLERFEREVESVAEQVDEPSFVGENPLACEFYVRMLFSMLVDADFLDTERHYTGVDRETKVLDAAALLRRIVGAKEAKATSGRINEIRNAIFEQSLVAAGRAPGFFSMTVPTGGGKTLSSMAFALGHAARHGLRRVIVVIPYLSIIEQNASAYRSILDPGGEGIVVEHHSGVKEDTDGDRNNEARRRSPAELAAENWDAPVVVTTSVQFVESLFGNRPSQCRKLHNIACSVVVFDEVQTLPTHLLAPLLNVLRQLRQHYGVSFLFSTATQPAFRRAPYLLDGFGPGEVVEVTEDTGTVFGELRRVAFDLPRDGETLDWRTVAERMAAERQALCVVNTRKQAFELWEELRRSLPEDERDALFHVSSAMCAEHRLDVLGEVERPREGTVRHRLLTGAPCRVVSTQCIEAGVDVDFPLVVRALGPLDSVVQAAGRCNREGRLTDDEGRPRLGQVVVFRPADGTLPSGVYHKGTAIAASMLARTDAERLATDPALFESYFSQLFQIVPTDHERRGEPSIQEDRSALRFRATARKAKVIKDDTVTVFVEYGEGRRLVAELRARPSERDVPRFDRSDLRRLQRFAVSLHERDFQVLLQLGHLRELLPNLNLYVLDEGLYHESLGLVVSQRPAEDFIL